VVRLDDVGLAETCFLDALRALRAAYPDQTFWTERDVVYWMQLRIRATAPDGFLVFNDWGLLPGPRRARSADLVIVRNGTVLLAVEFKFEPCKSRADIQAKKLPVIGWSSVADDIRKIEEYVTTGAAPVGWSVCIDEGGRYRAQPRHPGSTMEDWETSYNTHVTLTRYPAE
jgi:hypothetical protein